MTFASLAGVATVLKMGERQVKLVTGPSEGDALEEGALSMALR